MAAWNGAQVGSKLSATKKTPSWSSTDSKSESESGFGEAWTAENSLGSFQGSCSLSGSSIGACDKQAQAAVHALFVASLSWL